MAGGITIFLIVVLAMLALGFGLALYLTGGALWFGKTRPSGDAIEPGRDDGDRPEHVTTDRSANVHGPGSGPSRRASNPSA